MQIDLWRLRAISSNGDGSVRRGKSPGKRGQVAFPYPFEPQRGDLTKPRPTAWVNGTQTDTRALKGRNNPFQSQTYRSSWAIPCASSRFWSSSHALVAFLLRDVCTVATAIAAWGNTYLALSGLAVIFVI